MVAYHEGVIYVADTYTNKIQAVHAATGATKTTGQSSVPRILANSATQVLGEPKTTLPA